MLLTHKLLCYRYFSKCTLEFALNETFSSLSFRFSLKIKRISPPTYRRGNEREVSRHSIYPQREIGEFRRVSSISRRLTEHFHLIRPRAIAALEIEMPIVHESTSRLLTFPWLSRFYLGIPAGIKRDPARSCRPRNPSRAPPRVALIFLRRADRHTFVSLPLCLFSSPFLSSTAPIRITRARRYKIMGIVKLSRFCNAIPDASE